MAGLRPEESLGVGGRTWLKVERWLGPAFEPKVYERGPSRINIGCQAIAFFWLSATTKAERPAPRCVQPKAGWLVAGCWGCGKCRAYGKMPRHFSTGTWITSEPERASYPHFPQPRRRRPRDRFSFMGGCRPPNPPLAMKQKKGLRPTLVPRTKLTRTLKKHKNNG